MSADEDYDFFDDEELEDELWEQARIDTIAEEE